MTALLPPTTAVLLHSEYGASKFAVIAVSLVESSIEPSYGLAAALGNDCSGNNAHSVLLAQWWNDTAASWFGCRNARECDAKELTQSFLAALEPSLRPQLAARLAALARNSFFQPETIKSVHYDVLALPCRFIGADNRSTPLGPDRNRPRKGFLQCCFRPCTVLHNVNYEGPRVRATLLLRLSPARGAAPRPLHKPIRLLSSLPTSDGRPEDTYANDADKEDMGWDHMDALCLAGLPICVTVFTFEGRVCHQNAASIEYFGKRSGCRQEGPGSGALPPAAGDPDSAAAGGDTDEMEGRRRTGPNKTPAQVSIAELTGLGAADGTTAGSSGRSDLDLRQLLALLSVTPSHGDGGPNVLGQLFILEQSKLAQMLSVTAQAGGVWEGIVQVPSTMNPDGPSPSRSASVRSHSTTVDLGGMLATREQAGRTADISDVQSQLLAGHLLLNAAVRDASNDQAAANRQPPRNSPSSTWQSFLQMPTSTGSLPGRRTPADDRTSTAAAAAVAAAAAATATTASATGLRRSGSQKATFGCSVRATNSALQGNNSSSVSFLGLHVSAPHNIAEPNAINATGDTRRQLASGQAPDLKLSSFVMQAQASAMGQPLPKPSGGITGFRMKVPEAEPAAMAAAAAGDNASEVAAPLRAGGSKPLAIIGGLRPQRRSRLFGPSAAISQVMPANGVPDERRGSRRHEPGARAGTTGGDGEPSSIFVSEVESSRIQSVRLSGLFGSFTSVRPSAQRRHQHDQRRQGQLQQSRQDKQSQRDGEGDYQLGAGDSSVVMPSLPAVLAVGSSGGTSVQATGGGGSRRGPHALIRRRSLQRRYMSVDPLATSTWQVLFEGLDNSSVTITDAADCTTTFNNNTLSIDDVVDADAGHALAGDLPQLSAQEDCCPGFSAERPLEACWQGPDRRADEDHVTDKLQPLEVVSTRKRHNTKVPSAMSAVTNGALAAAGSALLLPLAQSSPTVAGGTPTQGAAELLPPPAVAVTTDPIPAVAAAAPQHSRQVRSTSARRLIAPSYYAPVHGPGQHQLQQHHQRHGSLQQPHPQGSLQDGQHGHSQCHPRPQSHIPPLARSFSIARAPSTCSSALVTLNTRPGSRTSNPHTPSFVLASSPTLSPRVLQFASSLRGAPKSRNHGASSTGVRLGSSVGMLGAPQGSLPPSHATNCQELGHVASAAAQAAPALRSCRTALDTGSGSGSGRVQCSSASKRLAATVRQAGRDALQHSAGGAVAQSMAAGDAGHEVCRVMAAASALATAAATAAAAAGICDAVVVDAVQSSALQGDVDRVRPYLDAHTQARSVAPRGVGFGREVRSSSDEAGVGGLGRPMSGEPSYTRASSRARLRQQSQQQQQQQQQQQRQQASDHNQGHLQEQERQQQRWRRQRRRQQVEEDEEASGCGEDVEGDGSQTGLAWHEIRAVAITNPTDGARYLVILQKDVTAKVEHERHIAQVSEIEHRLLEQIFPRHVLAYMTEEGFAPSPPPPPPPGRGQGPQVAYDGDAEAEVGAGSVDGQATAFRSSAPGIRTWRPYVRDCTRLATWHECVTVLFADIQGFTPMCKQLPPTVVMKFLNDLFVRFDAQLDSNGVYKVETIGDCYVVAGGLIREDADGMAAVQGGEVDVLQVDKVIAFAQTMLRSAAQVKLPTTGLPVKIRVGIHTGPVVSGVVGTRMPRFCLFGDTVNTASRMESTGTPGCIHISSDTYTMLGGCRSGWTPTGGIEVKGKGIMETFLWSPHSAGPSSSITTASNAAAAAAATTPAAGAGTAPGAAAPAAPAAAPAAATPSGHIQVPQSTAQEEISIARGSHDRPTWTSNGRAEGKAGATTVSSSHAGASASTGAGIGVGMGISTGHDGGSQGPTQGGGAGCVVVSAAAAAAAVPVGGPGPCGDREVDTGAAARTAPMSLVAATAWDELRQDAVPSNARATRVMGRGLSARAYLMTGLAPEPVDLGDDRAPLRTGPLRSRAHSDTPSYGLSWLQQQDWQEQRQQQRPQRILQNGDCIQLPPPWMPQRGVPIQSRESEPRPQEQQGEEQGPEGCAQAAATRKDQAAQAQQQQQQQRKPAWPLQLVRQQADDPPLALAEEVGAPVPSSITDSFLVLGLPLSGATVRNDRGAMGPATGTLPPSSSHSAMTAATAATAVTRQTADTVQTGDCTIVCSSAALQWCQRATAIVSDDSASFAACATFPRSMTGRTDAGDPWAGVRDSGDVVDITLGPRPPSEALAAMHQARTGGAER